MMQALAEDRVAFAENARSWLPRQANRSAEGPHTGPWAEAPRFENGGVCGREKVRARTWGRGSASRTLTQAWKKCLSPGASLS